MQYLQEESKIESDQPTLLIKDVVKGISFTDNFGAKPDC